MLLTPASPQENPALVDEVLGWMNATDPLGAAASLLAMRDRPNRTELLGRVTVPALVIGADRDQAIPVEQSRLLAEHLTDAELCILHGGGHMVNLEQPEGFNDALGEFLSKFC